MNKLIAWWHSLNPVVKTGIVLFGGAATGVLKHALTQPCQSATCWKGYLISAGHAGVVALVAWMVPSPLEAPRPPQA